MTTPDARTPTTPHITPHTPLPTSHFPLPRCIIRSTFLGAIKEAYDSDPSLSNLLLAPYFVELVGRCQAGWRAVVSQAALLGVPTPAFSTALSFFDGYRTARLPANLLQARADAPEAAARAAHCRRSHPGASSAARA